MHFNLTIAPATFMIYVDDLLRPFIGKCVIVYLNDIMIFSRSWEEHVKQIRNVLDSDLDGYWWPPTYSTGSKQLSFVAFF